MCVRRSHQPQFSGPGRHQFLVPYFDDQHKKYYELAPTPRQAVHYLYNAQNTGLSKTDTLHFAKAVRTCEVGITSINNFTGCTVKRKCEKYM
jgi:hypothetical protein